MRRYLPLAILTLVLFVSLPASAGDFATPVSAVESFHEALAGGDRSAVLQALSPDVVIYESGWIEASRDEYASHHLGSDMEFSSATKREVVSRDEHVAGKTAWVVTESTTTGEFRDHKIHSVGIETMILERTDEGWKIVHIHWSSRKAGEDH